MNSNIENNIKQIFFYSKKISKENNCYYTYGMQVLKGLVLVFSNLGLIILFIILGTFLNSIIFNVLVYIFAGLLWPLLIIFIYYNSRNLSTKSSSYLITHDGKIFKLSLATSYYGRYAGKYIYSNCDDMADPNMIARYYYDMIHFKYIYPVKLEILKVYKVVEKNKYFCITCDCLNHFNGKLYYRIKIYIYKCYVRYQELINILINMKNR